MDTVKDNKKKTRLEIMKSQREVDRGLFWFGLTGFIAIISFFIYASLC